MLSGTAQERVQLLPTLLEFQFIPAHLSDVEPDADHAGDRASDVEDRHFDHVELHVAFAVKLVVVTLPSVPRSDNEVIRLLELRRPPGLEQFPVRVAQQMAQRVVFQHRQGRVVVCPHQVCRLVPVIERFEPDGRWKIIHQDAGERP